MKNLKTISQYHLNEWNQTANGANIIGINKNYIKGLYHKFYENLNTEVTKNYPFASFVKIWRNNCNKSCKTLENYLKTLNPNINNEEVSKVVNKFRGNVAEIFFEAAVQYARFDWILPDNYNPVDPHHEEQLDGEGISPYGDYPIGVQIKNWNRGNQISRHVFNEVGGMIWKWISREKLKDVEKYLPMKRIYMYVVSFDSEGYYKGETNNDLDETMGGGIRFIGPDDIDKVFYGRKCPLSLFDDLPKIVV